MKGGNPALLEFEQAVEKANSFTIIVALINIYGAELEQEIKSKSGESCNIGLIQQSLVGLEDFFAAQAKAFNITEIAKKYAEISNRNNAKTYIPHFHGIKNKVSLLFNDYTTKKGNIPNTEIEEAYKWISANLKDIMKSKKASPSYAALACPKTPVYEEVNLYDRLDEKTKLKVQHVYATLADELAPLRKAVESDYARLS
jgi:hypothetical protein